MHYYRNSAGILKRQKHRQLKLIKQTENFQETD